MSKKVESKDGGFTMDLGTGDVTFKGTTGINHSSWKYQDEKGNKITKEEFEELRIKKLEGKISALEQTISSLATRVSDSEGNITGVEVNLSNINYKLDVLNGELNVIKNV